MTTPVLELDAVSASYGQFNALFDVSLRVDPGSAVALLGHNGMGKTTTARVGSGLVKPTKGRILVNGEDFTGEPAHRFARAGIAHAPEGRSVFATLTVAENLELAFNQHFGRGGLGPAMERTRELFPQLAHRMSQVAGSLSGGEQRMLTLARVMVLEPQLLIADELSLGLAPIVIDAVYGVLARIREAGTALLVVEQHVQHALDVADTAIVLNRGRVVYSGPTDERSDLLAAVNG